MASETPGADRRDGDDVLRATFAAMGVAGVVFDGDGRIVSQDGALAALLGGDGIRPCDATALAAALPLVSASGAAVAPADRPEARALRGETGTCDFGAAGGRRIEVSFAPVGAGAGAVVTFRDVTAGRAAEERRAAFESRARLAFDVARLAVWDLDFAAGTLVWSGSPAELWHGSDWGNPRTIEEFREILHPADRDRVAALLATVLASGEPFASDYRIVNRRGEVRWLVGRGRAVAEPDGRVVRIQGVSIDVTDRHELEEALRQSQKMESIGQLAGGVAHDFNNLLMVQRGWCETARARLRPDDPVALALAQVEACTDRGAALTRQLLAFSRRQTLQPQVVDLNVLVEGLSSMLRRMIGEDVALTTSRAPSPACVLADPGQLEQVIMNLAVNARDAMPGGGRLSISVAHEEIGGDATSPAACAGAKPGPCVVVSVADTGRGMDEATLARIFEPFFTTKPAGRGTGLGLSTAYGIVRQSGGVITVESAPGRGSTFRVHLPRTASAPPAAAAAPASSGPAKGAGETVLVVEDDAALRRLVEQLVRSLGYRPVVAPDGAAALRLVESEGLRPHLVLTDVVMPGMGGRELVERLRRAQPGLSALFMSGYTDDPELRAGIAASSERFLQKPFTTAKLAAAMQSALAAARGGAAGS